MKAWLIMSLLFCYGLAWWLLSGDQVGRYEASALACVALLLIIGTEVSDRE